MSLSRCRNELHRGHTFTKSTPVRWLIFSNMEWHVATSWQLRGPRGFYYIKGIV